MTLEQIVAKLMANGMTEEDAIKKAKEMLNETDILESYVAKENEINQNSSLTDEQKQQMRTELWNDFDNYVVNPKEEELPSLSEEEVKNLEEKAKKKKEKLPSLTEEELNNLQTKAESQKTQMNPLVQNLLEPFKDLEKTKEEADTIDPDKRIDLMENIEDPMLEAKIANAKHAKPDTIEPGNRIVLTGKTKKAKPSLVEKWKNLDKKKKIAIIVGAVVAVGVVVGAVVHAALTGDSSAIGQAMQVEPSTVTQTIADSLQTATPDSALVNEFAETDPNAITQVFDPNYNLEGQQIFSSAYDTTGMQPAIDNAFVGDYFNPETGQYANADLQNMTMDQIEQLKANGYTTSLLTNDPNMIGQGGNTIAEAGKATGFVK